MIELRPIHAGIASTLLLATAVGCGPSTTASGGAGTGDDSVDAGPSAADAAPDTRADAAPPAQVAEVFAHSSTTLYRLDPDTLEVVVVGDFNGCSSVVDLAVDKDSKIFATTFSGLYSINRDTAACTLIAAGSYPNSLSFVPVGVLDPNQEVMVAYNGSQYIRIDPGTGEITNIGSISGGFASSGDVVSVEGGGTFLTASGPSCDDCLLEIDPANGSMIKNWGPLGFTAVYGLAYWGGVAYGFDDSGAAFQIDFGANEVTSTPITIPAAPANLSFWGAGSTTKAPTID